MRKRLPAVLTLLGAVLVVAGASMAADLVDPKAEGVSAPYLIASSRVSPSYPPAAHAAKVNGVVELKVTVNKNGKVGDVQLVNSSRQNMGFETAARKAVSQWRFEPANLEGQAVDSFTSVRLSFNPPSSASRGFVSVGFEGSGHVPSSMGMTAPVPSKEGIATTSQNYQDAVRPNFLPTDNKVLVMGKPSGAIGYLYDQRTLRPGHAMGFGTGHTNLE